jgi:lipopolysaccharide transport protein LptA
VTGQTIHLQSGSQYIRAEGRVEATLLPEAGGVDEDGGGDQAGIFREGQAIHFVARLMEGSPDGETIRFSDDVRGWQGERTLSADTIQLENSSGNLLAEGKVGTRLPGRQADSLADADFIHISGNRLEYSDEQATAVYTGEVRVRQDEGWMETDRLEAELKQGGSDLEILRAVGNVVLEYRVRSDTGQSEQVQGDSDRAEYRPDEAVVRLFGDRKRATLRRSGPEAVTIFGRILRYYLDEGTIEVEKGLSGRSRIQTPEGGREEPSGGE